MGSDGDVVDFVRVSDLDLDALAERREELREDDLLVPNRFVAALLHRRLPLRTPDGNNASFSVVFFKPDPEQ